MREPLRQDIGLHTSAVLPCNPDKHILSDENNFPILETYVSGHVRSIADPENESSSLEADAQSLTDDVPISCPSRIVPRILVQPPSSPILGPISENEAFGFPGVLEELGDSKIEASERTERDGLLSVPSHTISHIGQKIHGRAQCSSAGSTSFPSTAVAKIRTLCPTYVNEQPSTSLTSPEAQEAEVCQADLLDKGGAAWKPSLIEVDEVSPIQTTGGMKDPAPYGIRTEKAFTVPAASFNLDGQMLNEHNPPGAIFYRPAASSSRTDEENPSMMGEAGPGSRKTVYQEENLGEMALLTGAGSRSTQQRGRESDLSTKPLLRQPEKQRRHVLVGLIAPRESSAVQVDDRILRSETELQNEAYQPRDSSMLVPTDSKGQNLPSQGSSRQAVAPPMSKISRQNGDGHSVPFESLAKESEKDRDTVIIDTSPPHPQHRNTRTGDQSSSLDHVKRVIASLLSVYDVQEGPGFESVRKFIVKGRWVGSEETTENASIFPVEQVSTEMVGIERAKMLEDAEDLYAPDGFAAMTKLRRSETEGTHLISLALAQMTNLQVFE